MPIPCDTCGGNHSTPAVQQDCVPALLARVAGLEAENLRLRKIAAHVPAKTYIAAKESAGYGVHIKSRSAGCVCGTGVFCAPCAFPE